MTKRKSKFDLQSSLITVALVVASLLLERYVPTRVLVYLALIAALSPFVFWLIWRAKNDGSIHQNASKAVITCFSGFAVGSVIGFFYLAISAFRYRFVGNGFWNFILISAIVGLLPGAYFARKTWLSLRKNQEKLHTGIISTIAVLILGALATIFYSVNLNYALDSHTPQECCAVIENKDYDSRRKGPDSYEFIIRIEGDTFDLEVTHDDYTRYAVGDTYTVYKFQGAFGQSFYHFRP